MGNQDVVWVHANELYNRAERAQRARGPIRSAAEEQHLREAEDYRQREAARLAEKRKRWAAEEKAEKAARESRIAEERRDAAAKLKTEIRSHFFASNAGATDEDFTRLWPQLRDAHLLANTRDPLVDEVAALRRQYGDELL